MEVVPPLVATLRAWQARLSRAARDGEPLVKSSYFSPENGGSGYTPTVWIQFFHSF
ncbi:MAG: hypothetical protein HYV36_07000 [Lentisphaerae bacterium]|nr:hypothetical protein [Lentisphaerota bacterium]